MKLTNTQCKKIKEVLKNAYGNVVEGMDSKEETLLYVKDRVVKRIKEIVDKESESEVCDHDWQAEQYNGMTSDVDRRKWRCKKCLAVRWTKE